MPGSIQRWVTVPALFVGLVGCAGAPPVEEIWSRDADGVRLVCVEAGDLLVHTPDGLERWSGAHGVRQWQVPLPGQMQPDAGCTQVVSVVHGAIQAVHHTIDARSGTVLHTLEVPALTGPEQPADPQVVAQVGLGHDRVVLGPWGVSRQGRMGDLWSVELSQVHTILGDLHADDQVVVVELGTHGLVGVSAADGAQLWRVQDSAQSQLQLTEGWMLYLGSDGARVIPAGQARSVLVQPLDSQPVITTKGSGSVQEKVGAFGVAPPFVLVGGEGRARWLRVHPDRL